MRLHYLPTLSCAADFLLAQSMALADSSVPPTLVVGCASEMLKLKSIVQRYELDWTCNLQEVNRLL
jgi:hypothetical protein